MAGAIIPDDWDGSTFECNRIEWPASEKWQAILLGQVSEASQESYWDSQSGDEEDAATAVQTAYRQTTQNIFTVGCDEMIPGIPVPAFKVTKDVDLGLSATTWTIVPWEEFVYEKNAPEFSLAASAHAVRDPDLFGLWHYEVILHTVDFEPMYIGIWKNPGSTLLGYVGGELTPVGFSFDYIWEDTDDLLTVQVWTFTAQDIDADPLACLWSGTFLGPVEAP